jgi:hypothetical protein
MDPAAFLVPKPAPTPSSTVALPSPPEGAPVLLMTEAAELLGVKVCAFRTWISGRGRPNDLCAYDGGEMVRPTRYRAPGKWVRNPKICLLRREIEALAAQIDASNRPLPHPDTVNFPGCHLVPFATRGGRKEWQAPGKGGRHVLIDSANVPLVEGLRWNIHGRSDCGAGEPGRDVVLAANRTITLKQVILGLRTIDRNLPLADQPTPPLDADMRIVHRNGDDLDCRRANLEIRTQAQVCYGNSKMRGRRGEELTSQYKGVCWVEQSECWGAYIRKGKSYYLGMFDEEDDAAREYDNAARWLFGEHAHLNFPLERPALRIPRAGALSRPGAIERAAAA